MVNYLRNQGFERNCTKIRFVGGVDGKIYVDMQIRCPLLIKLKKSLGFSQRICQHPSTGRIFEDKFSEF